MVIDEVDGTVAQCLKVFELIHNMLGTARTPLTLVEDGNIAEDAWPRAAARGLHGSKPLH